MYDLSLENLWHIRTNLLCFNNIDASTKVKMNGREKGFQCVKVGVHQGSVLSPLLFIIVLEALSREFREGLPMELLYVDDLVLNCGNKGIITWEVEEMEEGYGKEGSESKMLEHVTLYIDLHGWKDKGHVVSGEQGSGWEFRSASMWCLQEGS